MFKETKRRSFMKALSWRIIATVTTTCLVYFFTGQWAIAFSVGALEAVTKMAIYFFHERLWDRIKYGRKEVNASILWFTGLSGAGKSTISERVVQRLEKEGLKVEHLDGDVVREIFPQTGFTKEERNQHVKRVGFLASRLQRKGIFVVASFISPYREAREFVRGLSDHFHEIYISTPLSVRESRDVKGLYAKARKGEIQHFTGIDDPYEIPISPELNVNTENMSIEASVDQVMDYIKKLY